MTCSSPRPTRFVCRPVLFLLLLAHPEVSAAQRPTLTDETLVTQVAGLLAAADTRRLDAALFRDALANPNPAVRRQAALAAGRIGDSVAVDLLVPVREGHRRHLRDPPSRGGLPIARAAGAGQSRTGPRRLQMCCWSG